MSELVGQLLLPYVSGARSDSAHQENLRRFEVATPAQAVQALQLGGVLYFGWSHNVQAVAQVAELSRGLQHASPTPLTIAIDQETGSVARMASGLTQFPGAMALGATGDPTLTYAAHEIVGRELRALGITTDYAPVADVNVNPDNPVIGIRSFSADPEEVAAHVAAAVAALQSTGVSATVKHFPGHGDTAVDSHVALPAVVHDRAEWERVDAPPFRAAIRAGCDAVMTGHLSFPELDASGEPATLSHALTTGLLRDELGFEGVVVTDSLRMAGVRLRYDDGEIAVRALEAGADVLLDPELPLVAHRAVLDAVASGRLSRERIEQSVQRILALKRRRGLIVRADLDPGTTPEVGTLRVGTLRVAAPVVGTPADRLRAQQITDRSVTLLRDEADLVPLPAGSLLVTGWGETAVPWLADALARSGRTTTSHPTGSKPTTDDITRAVSLARRHDLVLVTTASVREDAAQRDLVAALLASGRPVVVVALRDPYDLAALPGVRTGLLTYSTTEVSLSSLTRVLDGRIRAQGRLPVSLPLDL